jgi:cystathionine beta-lyase/cystathionine gamma-synthase
MKFETLAFHAGQAPDPSTGALTVPIYQTSTYAQEAPGVHKGYDYSRTRNPTRTALEENLAALEGGSFGLAFSSGMAAANAVMNLLKAGDHVVAGNDLYGGTYRLFTKVYAQYGLTFTFVDATRPERVEEAFRPETRLLWIESLIEHPASMTHGSIPEQVRRAAGLADNLVRLSVGFEHIEDLLTDLKQALEKV